MRSRFIGNCGAAIAATVATVFSAGNRLAAAPLLGGEDITCSIDNSHTTKKTCLAAVHYFRKELSQLLLRRNSPGSLLNAHSYAAQKISLEKGLLNAYDTLKHIAPDEVDKLHGARPIVSKSYLFGQSIVDYPNDNYSGVTAIGQLATSAAFDSIYSVVGTITVPTLSVPAGDPCVAPTIYDASEWLGIGGEEASAGLRLEGSCGPSSRIWDRSIILC